MARRRRLRNVATVPVVTYTAIVDVANPGERLRPGMTAEVNLDGSRRDHAVRIPNNALAFRPSPDVLKALGEVEPSLADFATDESDKDGEPREVWEYDGKRFAPIGVRAGLADGGWTEAGGAVAPGTAPDERGAPPASRNVSRRCRSAVQ